ncbi:hypothetical protein [Paenibacillus tianjinensis]|nr:hypothetical protein [Paenibacillus tianjinensis]
MITGKTAEAVSILISFALLRQVSGGAAKPYINWRQF